MQSRGAEKQCCFWMCLGVFALKIRSARFLYTHINIYIYTHICAYHILSVYSILFKRGRSSKFKLLFRNAMERLRQKWHSCGSKCWLWPNWQLGHGGMTGCFNFPHLARSVPGRVIHIFKYRFPELQELRYGIRLPGPGWSAMPYSCTSRFTLRKYM